MPTRGIGIGEQLPYGGLITTLAHYTLATYSAAGTAPPADGDIVSPTTTNNRVVLAPDDSVGLNGLGRVKGAPNTTDLTIFVEWFNVYAVVELDCDDATTATINNSAIKDGATTVVNNFDAGAAVGNLVVWAKSGTAGAIKLKCGVVITGKG